MTPSANLKQRAYDAWFRHVHTSKLIYNTCWEDPRADRAMLALNSQSRLAMITSAGCNALDYLLDDPAEIHCIDMNARQNALLELKMAAIAKLAFADLFKLFGEGRHAQFPALYKTSLRPSLSPSAQQFWDAHGHWFNGRGRGSFYYHGASGEVAWLIRLFLRCLRPGLRRKLIELFESQDMSEQRARYEALEPRLLGPWLRMVIRQPATLALLGVPRAQRDLLASQYPGGVEAFVVDKLRWLFTQLPVRDNYFWRIYLHGSYSRDCCPNYLRAENHELLRARLERLHVHTMSLNDFLQRREAPLTHFVLLDHQDWLCAHDVPALEEEWRSILRCSQVGARVLLRSAAMRVDFLPEFARGVLFNRVEAEAWHRRDRVGTYGCTLLAEIAA